MIHKAYEIGIKPAAKLFNTTPKTVRKWNKRPVCQQAGMRRMVLEV
jgi:hypothetical protein